MSLLESVRNVLTRTLGTELPCGCIVPSGTTDERFCDDVVVVERELETLHTVPYRNCTKHEQQWNLRIRCKQCGSEWDKRRKAGRKIDFGDENPDVDVKLELGWGKFQTDSEEPIVRETSESGSGTEVEA